MYTAKTVYTWVGKLTVVNRRFNQKPPFLGKPRALHRERDPIKATRSVVNDCWNYDDLISLILVISSGATFRESFIE
jgi:hypothetical protein